MNCTSVFPIAYKTRLATKPTVMDRQKCNEVSKLQSPSLGNLLSPGMDDNHIDTHMKREARFLPKRL